jgi:transcriptional regulator with XRE-family HTH domain
VHELKHIRLRRGLSQEDLARESGVSEFTISELELGKRPNPRPSTLRKLARGLGVEVADLYGDAVVAPKVEAAPSLKEWLQARCGHSYLALTRAELEDLFVSLDGVPREDEERRRLGLAVNDEYNTFCGFPSNVTSEERIAMRRVIRDAISEVAVKHQIALEESGLWQEYHGELTRAFELQRELMSEDIA